MHTKAILIKKTYSGDLCTSLVYRFTNTHSSVIKLAAEKGYFSFPSFCDYKVYYSEFDSDGNSNGLYLRIFSYKEEELNSLIEKIEPKVQEKLEKLLEFQRLFEIFYLSKEV